MVLGFVFLAAITVGGDAARAEVAAQAAVFLGGPGSAQAIVVREPFAVVEFDGPIAGERTRGELLYRRYRFGWQLVDLATGSFAPCRLAHAGAAARDISALLVNASGARDREPCQDARTSAVSSDETAIRANLQDLRSREGVGDVQIVGRYARADYFDGGGGGEAIFVKAPHGNWVKHRAGGGAYNLCDLIGSGVPPAIARRLTDVTPSAMELTRCATAGPQTRS